MIARLRSFLARARAARAGSAMMEFALGLPMVLYMGGYGVELGNYALVHLRVNQITLTLADNASRIGSSTGQAAYQVHESDINDVLQGARLMGAGIKLTTYGRITISSLENVKRVFNPNTGSGGHANDGTFVQRLHWQRCAGLRRTVGTPGAPGYDPYDSSYGQATPLDTAATDSTYANRGVEMSGGFGPAPLLNAPPGSAVIFVEVNYQYHPLFGNLFIASNKMHYVASFIVRDSRDYTQIFSSTAFTGTAVRSTCNLYAT